MTGMDIIRLVVILKMNSVKNININVIKNDLHIKCGAEWPQQDPPNITHVENLYIHDCKPAPFSRLITSNSTELLTLKKLELNTVLSDPPITEEHLRNLNTMELNIFGQHFLKPSPNFLNSLTMTRQMTLSNISLPPLPTSSQLEVISLSNGRSGAIGGCSALSQIHLRNWTIEETLGGWVASCQGVTMIFMEHVSAETINRVLLGANALEYLGIYKSSLVSISSNLLAGAIFLRFLGIKSSGLRSINEDAFRDQNFSLDTVDLSDNELRGETSARALLSLRGLETLYLAENPLSDFCEHFQKLDRAENVVDLHLESANISRLCFTSWRRLRLLSLDMNNITEMTLTELPLPLAMRILTVNLMHNPLRVPTDSIALYDALTKKFSEADKGSVLNITMDLTLDCDCKHGWFAKALRALPMLRMMGLRCHNNQSLVDQLPDQLECDKFECESCTCQYSWSQNKTEADCRHRSLSRVPHIFGVDSMLASNNRIEDVHADDFPTSLQLVDLSYNNLRRLNSASAHALLAQGSARRVRLAGNPLSCDCENEAFINALRKYTMKVDDYSQLQCGSGETALAQINVAALCGAAARRTWVLAAVAAVGMLVALVAMTTGLYFRYSRVVRVFLHARGLLCCLDDEETDGNYLYDAFIAFSHQDIDFVDGELLPRLENESNGWRICVHYRDWVPGEMIPTQIALSVTHSRRTIVVLSRNFLESSWAMLEFRTAYASALHDGRARLVLIVLDDVLDSDQLDSEVRGYVRTNTYIRWGDPWFWDKLLYVMPPRRTNQ